MHHEDIYIQVNSKSLILLFKRKCLRWILKLNLKYCIWSNVFCEPPFVWCTSYKNWSIYFYSVQAHQVIPWNSAACSPREECVWYYKVLYTLCLLLSVLQIIFLMSSDIICTRIARHNHQWKWNIHLLLGPYYVSIS